MLFHFLCGERAVEFGVRLLVEAGNRLLEAGADARSPADLARQLHVSERSLQRLAARFVGMPPQLLLRRRRLQEAAERMRDACERAGVTLADNHALTIAPMIARGALDKSLVAPFSARRFHVQEAG